VTFPAFFDTSALYGARLNDLLLWLADAGAFRPLWSADVMEELERNLLKNGEDQGLVGKRIGTMQSYFPDAMVDGYSDLIAGMMCDPKDRHVLAAAVRANAEVLVTFNLKDFPPESTAAFEIEVVHPDDFLLDQLDLFPGAVVGTLRHLVETYTSPPLSMDEILQSLTRAGVPKFANEVPRYL
jgi:predicted nucleic acid-binding protein